MCMPMTVSCWNMAETITILKSNYSPIKTKKKYSVMTYTGKES